MQSVNHYDQLARALTEAEEAGYFQPQLLSHHLVHRLVEALTKDPTHPYRRFDLGWQGRWATDQFDQPMMEFMLHGDVTDLTGAEPLDKRRQWVRWIMTFVALYSNGLRVELLDVCPTSKYLSHSSDKLETFEYRPAALQEALTGWAKITGSTSQEDILPEALGFASIWLACPSNLVMCYKNVANYRNATTDHKGAEDILNQRQCVENGVWLKMVEFCHVVWRCGYDAKTGEFNPRLLKMLESGNDLALLDGHRVSDLCQPPQKQRYNWPEDDYKRAALMAKYGSNMHMSEEARWFIERGGLGKYSP